MARAGGATRPTCEQEPCALPERDGIAARSGRPDGPAWTSCCRILRQVVRRGSRAVEDGTVASIVPLVAESPDGECRPQFPAAASRSRGLVSASSRRRRSSSSGSRMRTRTIPRRESALRHTRSPARTAAAAATRSETAAAAAASIEESAYRPSPGRQRWPVYNLKFSPVHHRRQRSEDLIDSTTSCGATAEKVWRSITGPHPRRQTSR